MRRVVLPLALLLLLVGGVVTVVQFVSVPDDGGESGSVLPTPLPSDGAGSERARRDRRRVTPRDPGAGDAGVSAPDTGLAPAPGTTDASMDAARDADSGAEALEQAVLEELTQALDDFRVALRELDPAIHASPDRDAVTDAPVEVAPGLQPALAFATYVSRGPATVSQAVESVGERQPDLEDGVPVSLTGRVLVDGEDTPVIGAEVVVTSTFYVRSTFYDHHLREVSRATTDADGRFTIERLNADPAHFGRGGKALVTVSALGFATVRGIPVADVTPGIRNRLDDVRLARATHSLRGIVTSIWDGTPVAGARVVATGAVDPIQYPKDQREALFLGAPETTTDADGLFVLEGLAAGPQMISVHGGDDCVGRQSFRLPIAAEQEVALRTRSIGGRVEGRVIDAFGDPVPLAFVDGGGNSTHSFADGRFVLENIRGDSYTIRCSHPEYRGVTVRDVADGTTGLTVRLVQRQPAIELDVQDAVTSAPVTEIAVMFDFGDGTWRPSTSPAHLANDGRHRVTLPTGAVRLVVGSTDRANAVVELERLRDGDVVPLLLERRND